MNTKQIGRLMTILLGVAAALIFFGALLKIQHHPYGNSILMYGFMASFVLSGFEINRLKKIINALEKEIEH